MTRKLECLEGRSLISRICRTLRNSLSSGRAASSARTAPRRRLEVENLDSRLVPAALSLSSLQLTYTAAAGEANRLTISESNGIITFHDSGATIGVRFLPGTQGISVIDSHTVSVSSWFVSSMRINLGDRADTFNLYSTNRAMTVDMGAGADRINVGDPSRRQLDGLQAQVNLNGGADTDEDVLAVSSLLDDQDYIVTRSSVTWGSQPGLTYAAFQGLTINLGAAATNSPQYNTVILQSTAAGTPVTINGGAVGWNMIEAISIGDETHSADGIQGTVTYNGRGQGLNFLVLQDQASTAGHTYTVTDHSLTRNGSAAVKFSEVTGIYLKGTDYADTLKIQGKLPSFTPPGDDFPARSNDFDLGGGANTVIGPNTDNTWWFKNYANGRVDADLVSDGWNAGLHGISAVTAGSGDDIFMMTATGQLAGSLNGGGGANTLDYSAYTSRINVNLATGAATGVAGGISNIFTVIGSDFNDTLVGHGYSPSVLVGRGGNDKLFGGSARGILIGGAGQDTIQGGTTDDIVISGWTDHDTSPWALNAIMKEWARTDLPVASSYKLRTNHILGTDRSTPRLNGEYYFTSSVGGTVHDDFDTDLVIGGTGMDAFWAKRGEVTDLALNEILN